MSIFQIDSNKYPQNHSQSLSNSQGLNLVQKPAITVKGVEMSVKSGREMFQIIKGIDWEIPSGIIQILMGPSGSGKTTLLSILAGLLTPTAGKIEIIGEDITKMSRSKLSQFRLHNIGFIFQGFNLFPALTASENVEVALNLKGIKGKTAKNEANILLEQVGLKDKVNQMPRDLSGGEKQRVAIARALAGKPKIIMADEPTAALDSQSGHAVIELLSHLAKEEGCTVLMVTHDPRMVDIADNVANLEDGVLKKE